MSQEDFQKARKRLARVKKEVLWAIAVLEDPSANLERYNLSQDEVEELFQEFHADLTDIQTAIAQLLSQRRHIQVEDKRMFMVGPIPPWLSNLESVGPIIPWSRDVESKSSRTSRKIGENKANQSELSAGAVKPWSIDEEGMSGQIKHYEPNEND